MGDVVFAPLYELLEKRGVRFRFFHRVDALETTTDDSGTVQLSRIRLSQQATVADYEPLFTVDSVRSWPTRPGHVAINKDRNYEDYAPHHDDVPTSIDVGKDFDSAICALSIGGLAAITNSHFRRAAGIDTAIAMADSVETSSSQLWLNHSVSPPHTLCAPFSMFLGFTPDGVTPAPLETWSDFSHLIEHTPAAGRETTACVYLAGIKRPGQELDKRTAHSLHSFSEFAQTSVPRVVEAYHHESSNPSDQYVRAPAGRTRFRLNQADLRLHNLVFAGDWTRTRLNLGSIESATMSGIQAATILINRRIGDSASLYARIVGAFSRS
jgi:uncharacterized protein with NAD-binding domain and iron-sulfur cluster